MDSLIQNEYPSFQVIGQEEQSLQVLLLPGQSIKTHLPNIIYSSPKVRIKKVKTSLLNSVFNVLGDSPVQDFVAHNKEGGCEYLGLCKEFGGKILCLNPEVTGKLVIRSNAVLAYSGVSTEEFKPKMIMRRYKWLKVKSDGLLFIQTSGNLIEKVLGSDEEIEVNGNTLVGFSASARIQAARLRNNVLSKFIHDWNMVRLKGPGRVYIEGTNWGKLQRVSQLRKGELTYMVTFFLLMLLMFVFEKLLLI